MHKDRFDPFADRQARLLRNRMAAGLGAALKAGDPRLFRQIGHEQLACAANPAYQSYLQERLRLYECAFASIVHRNLDEPFAQALLLWNLGLFYEVHELLEPLWLQSSGARRLALQAMIRAAGTYVHLQAGNRQAAQGMAAKAAAALQANSALPPFAGREQLLAALGNLDLAPPRLGSAGDECDEEDQTDFLCNQ